MKRMIAMLLATVLAAGTFTTTVFAADGDTGETSAVQETSGDTESSETDTEEAETEDKLTNSYEITVDEDGNTVIIMNGKEYVIEEGAASSQVGTVVDGISALHFRTGPGTDYEIIGYLHSGDQVEIIEQSGDWYKVTFNGKTGYAHGKYLTVEEVVSESDTLSTDALLLLLDMMQAGTEAETEETDTGLTPEGNLTLVDDIGTEEEDQSGQQFITMVTKAGNTFYLVIDRDSDGNQNVHFLNMVDEADLLALMEEEDAAQYEAADTSETEPVETAEEAVEEEEEETVEEEPEQKGSVLPLVMLALFLIGAAGVGGYLFIKMRGGKPGSRTDQPDPDADYQDEDEEEIELPEESESDEEADEEPEYYDGDEDEDTV